MAGTDRLDEEKNKELDQRIRNKIAGIDAVADELPCVIIVHNIKTHAVEYMSSRGQKILSVSLEELKAMGKDYHMRFFNPEEAKKYVPKIFGMLERNNSDEVVSFYQQVRASEAEPWSWYFSTSKIFLRDHEGLPLLTITQAYPIDEHHKLEQLSTESFLKNNLARFAKLTEQECEILGLLAIGKSAEEAAHELSLSTSAIEALRKSIETKLETDSFYELIQFARAFELI